jgi:predicted peroxiredoxin
VKSRCYDQEDLFDGVVIVGASVMHAEIKEGAHALKLGGATRAEIGSR